MPRMGCPSYAVRMVDGAVTVKWADESDEDWAARQSDPGSLRARFRPATVTRRQIRDGRWLTCGSTVH